MSNIWADTFSEIREPFLQEKKEKEETKEKNEKEDNDDKPKRWWDDDGDGVGYEKGEVSDKFPKKKVKKEEVEQIDELSHDTYRSVAKKQSAKVGALQDAGKDDTEAQNRLDRTKRLRKKAFVEPKAPGARNPYAEERDLHSTDKNDKIDVRKGIKNKVNTKPTVSEELEAWIGELLEEGYDLSSFTLEEVAEIYESVEVEQLDEADTYGMPARGDAERQSSDPMAAAKAKAAKAKLAKERAEVQVAQQAQRLKVSATESVLHYVSGRTPLFEGRFDPKKSKLRPASERTQNAMTYAQRKAAKKEDERVAQIHSKGATVLAGLTSSGKRGKVKTTPEPKAPAPEANRRVRGKEDKLAAAADAVLKNLRNK